LSERKGSFSQEKRSIPRGKGRRIAPGRGGGGEGEKRDNFALARAKRYFAAKSTFKGIATPCPGKEEENGTGDAGKKVKNLTGQKRGKNTETRTRYKKDSAVRRFFFSSLGKENQVSGGTEISFKKKEGGKKKRGGEKTRGNRGQRRIGVRKRGENLLGGREKKKGGQQRRLTGELQSSLVVF